MASDMSNHSEDEPASPALPSISSLTEPNTLPTLSSASHAHHVKSHATLLIIITLATVGSVVVLNPGILSLHSSPAPPFQPTTFAWTPVLGLGAGALSSLVAFLWWTDSFAVDWWTVIRGYWWLYLPIVTACGVSWIMIEEAGVEIAGLE
jgi:hypothetical protein